MKKKFRRRPFHFYGKNEMVVALYAGLFDERVKAVIMSDAPASHWRGPALLNVLRVTDIPEVAAAFAPRELVFLRAMPPGFAETEALLKRTGNNREHSESKAGSLAAGLGLARSRSATAVRSACVDSHLRVRLTGAPLSPCREASKAHASPRGGSHDFFDGPISSPGRRHSRDVLSPRLCSLALLGNFRRWFTFALPRAVLLAWAFILSVTGSGPLSAQTAAETRPRWLYRLLNDSYLLDDCPVCARPAIQEPMRGTFDLRLVETNPLLSRYAVENIDFKAGSTRTYAVKGSGTFQVGGEVVMVQQLDLHVEIDDGVAKRSCDLTTSSPVRQRALADDHHHRRARRTARARKRTRCISRRRRFGRSGSPPEGSRPRWGNRARFPAAISSRPPAGSSNAMGGSAAPWTRCRRVRISASMPWRFCPAVKLPSRSSRTFSASVWGLLQTGIC